MSEGWVEKIEKWFTLALIAAVFAGGLLFAWPTYRRGQSLRRQDAELTARIERKQREIAKLRENQKRFLVDSAFVEHIARQHGRVHPGELVFIFNEK